MNLLNEEYSYYPDVFGNLDKPESERIVWVIQPPTLREVQTQDSEEKRIMFFRRLLDKHVKWIRNMEIGGESIETVEQMESMAAQHLSPRQNKQLGEELLRAFTCACFLSEEEVKN